MSLEDGLCGVIGDEVRLRTRFSYDYILAKASWKSLVVLKREAIAEFEFWLKNIDKLNKKGSELSQLTKVTSENVQMFCDASDVGYGGHLTFESTDKSDKPNMFGSWSISETKQSSTWRELEAVHRVFKNSVSRIEGKSVKIYTDNKHVSHILKVVSKKPYLQEKAMSVHDTCSKY
ncbi:Hypothetical predicted protein [Mytilus galloprovincialis]|uniref:Reverse transcriptase RNase H-like domain-containing protein n=1 Tax=Mytilus galloprovincialis TaxID=29158 RepID=A0A8B6HM31_MYTGA|nr:Hypothetical predicted protein [Mytilus galloprovincialis]